MVKKSDQVRFMGVTGSISKIFPIRFNRILLNTSLIQRIFIVNWKEKASLSKILKFHLFVYRKNILKLLELFQSLIYNPYIVILYLFFQILILFFLFTNRYSLLYIAIKEKFQVDSILKFWQKWILNLVCTQHECRPL